MDRSTDDLVKITSAGGGLMLDAEGKSTEELIRIAAAAGASDATLIVKNVGSKTTDELIDIATAGDGGVVFEL